MELTHFLALIPLLVLLICSVVFYGKGLLHLTTLGYAGVLGFVAITNNWELLLFAPVVGTAIISLVLFAFAMNKGGWL